MPIGTNRFTRLTNDLERDFVRLGGGNPDKAIAREALGETLVRAIETIDTHNPELLDRMFEKMSAQLPPEERRRLETLAANTGP